jgi:hypothetical protein
MAFDSPPATIEGVRDPDRIKRYTLVPRSPAGAKPDGVKRFTLARVGASPRSALGADRLERMEQIADGDRERQSRNGDDPAKQERLCDESDDQASRS